jgi:hypothetical protein
VKGELGCAGPTKSIQRKLDAADLTKSLVLAWTCHGSTVNRQSSGGLNSSRGSE